MGKVRDKLKDKYGKVNKKALVMAIALMCMSWAALPIVYWLIVRKKKPVEEVNVHDEKKNSGKMQNKEN
jgi:hypothetical protein